MHSKATKVFLYKFNGNVLCFCSMTPNTFCGLSLCEIFFKISGVTPIMSPPLDIILLMSSFT